MDDWYYCGKGGDSHRHWGKLGAAGLFLVCDGQVLLQLRSAESHGGDFWSIPGGAIEPGESPLDAALRETAEEVGIYATVDEVEILGEHVFTCGDWSYTTIIAKAAKRADPEIVDWETADARWVSMADIGTLALLPAFKKALPRLLQISQIDALPKTDDEITLTARDIFR